MMATKKTPPPEEARALNETTRTHAANAADAARRMRVFADEATSETCLLAERSVMLAAAGRWTRRAEEEARAAEEAARPYSRTVTITLDHPKGKKATLPRSFWKSADDARKHASTAVRTYCEAVAKLKKAKQD